VYSFSIFLVYTKYYTSSGSAAVLFVPDTIKGKTIYIIEATAFKDCITLTSVSIPSLVEVIGSSAFSGCTRLESVKMPSIKVISDSAFSGCSKLTSVTIPYTVTSIGNEAFYDCTSLESMILPYSVTSINSNTFSGCTSLTSVTILAVVNINDSAFSGCSALTSVTVWNNNPPTLGSNVFESAHPDLKIYVPFGIVDDYKDADDWSVYADKIFAIP